MAPAKAKSSGRIHPCPQEFDQVFPAKNLLPSLSHNPSAQWLMAAVDVLLSSYSELLKILQNPQQCLLLDNHERVDRYLEDLIKHVDSCNEMRESVWDIKSYQTLLCQTVRCMDRSEFMSKDIGAMSKLAECIGAVKAKSNIGQIKRYSISLEMLEKLGSLRMCTYTLLEDMKALNECTTFVVKAFVKALSMKKKQGPVVSYCSLAFRFCKKLRDRARSSSHLYELYMADVSVRGLYDLLAEDKTEMIDGEEMHERVEMLKKWEAELEKAICPLGCKIEELHKALISTRVASLDRLSYSV